MHLIYCELGPHLSSFLSFMNRLFFDVWFYFWNFIIWDPRKRIDEANAPWDPSSFGMHEFQGGGSNGRVRSHIKKFRFNLLKISSRSTSHVMRRPIFSPANIAYMSGWMAKIQNKIRKKRRKRKENKTKKGSAKEHGRPMHGMFHVVYTQVGPIICHKCK